MGRYEDLQQITGIGPRKAAAIVAAERRGGSPQDAFGIGRVLGSKVEQYDRGGAGSSYAPPRQQECYDSYAGHDYRVYYQPAPCYAPAPIGIGPGNHSFTDYEDDLRRPTMATRAPSPPVQQYQPPAPAARPPTPPPKDGPDYKRCLGKGGFGAVYAGKWKGEDVAYKVIDLAGEHESIFELANRELETLKEATRLIPEYVINIKSWYEEGEKLFIVMEKACCDLLMWVQNKRKGDAGLSLSLWNSVAVDIVTALSEFHRHGFIHKDIKPRNILVTRDSEGWAVPKLGDLGLSKKLGATTSRCVTGGRRRATGTGAGTPAYMAPEQKYTRKLTLAADIWACAVVLVEIKTGVYPYSHDDESDEPFDERHFKSFPPALKKTLQECLSLQPCKRPSAKKLLDALLQRDNEE